VSGRELSVVDVFQAELFQACLRNGAIDLKISLNGSDRVFNADTMFSSNEHFFLVEFKSSLGELKSEDRKPAACILCDGLFTYPNMLELHQQCHYAMWGKKQYNGNLGSVYGVYEDLICRPKTLPLCESVWQTPIHRDAELDEPKTWEGKELAVRAAQKTAGLDREKFLYYLEWLLWARTSDGGSTATGALPIMLFGTSLLGGVSGMPFKNFQSLEAWAQPFIDEHNRQRPTAQSTHAPEPPDSPALKPGDESDSRSKRSSSKSSPGPR
jgi:hypothetical protein